MTLKLNCNVGGVGGGVGGGGWILFAFISWFADLECDVSGGAVYLSMHRCLRRMNKVAGIGQSIFATPHSHSNWDPNDGLSTKMNMKNHKSCCLDIINSHIPKKTVNHLWWGDSARKGIFFDIFLISQFGCRLKWFIDKKMKCKCFRRRGINFISSCPGGISPKTGTKN